MAATYEDADWAGTALLSEVVAGDLTKIVANFEIKATQGCSRVVQRAAANDDCVNSAIFAIADNVENCGWIDWQVHEWPNA